MKRMLQRFGLAQGVVHWLVIASMAVSTAACTTTAPRSQSSAASDTQTAIARGIAKVQPETIPYEGMSSRVQLKAGQTYLAFMKNEVKPRLDKFSDKVRNHEDALAGHWSDLQESLIKAHMGVAVRIDENNYIFNVGYLDGSDQFNDVRSGRSYGVGPTGRQSDPSDIFYLKELEKLYKKEPDNIGKFVRAIMQVLIASDTSGWAELSELGQTVATDFLAIYTAESDRHLMVDLAPRKHPWEIDLAAATFVTVFTAATGKVMQDGELVDGDATNWWAKGVKGSGIGQTRNDRKRLQALIAKNSDMAAIGGEIAEAIGETDSDDAIQSVFEYLNAADGPMKLSAAKAKKLTDLMVQYIEQLHESASAIAKKARRG